MAEHIGTYERRDFPRVLPEKDGSASSSTATIASPPAQAVDESTEERPCGPARFLRPPMTNPRPVRRSGT